MRDMDRSAASGDGSKPQGAAAPVRAPLPRPLDLSLLAPLVSPATAHGREGNGGDGGWLLACGVDHTLIGVRGAAVDQGVVALGVLSEGHGCRGIDSQTGLLLPGPEALPGEVLVSLARSVLTFYVCVCGGERDGGRREREWEGEGVRESALCMPGGF